MSLILITISAILTALAFPKLNFYFLAFVSLMPLFFVLSRADYKKVLGYGLWWGFVFYLQILSGLLALQEYAPLFLLILAVAALALAEALFISAALWIGKFVQTHSLGQGFWRQISTALGYAFAWVLLDWVRSLGTFGFTAGGLAYSQYLFTDFIQLARFGGAHSLTFIIVLINALGGICAARIRQADKTERKNWLITFLIIIFLACLTLYCARTSMNYSVEEDAPRKKVTIFQPAVSQKMKLDYYFTEEIKEMYVQNIQDYSQRAQTDLLVLPETIVPEFILESKEFMFALRDALNFSLVFGAPRREKNSERYYNSVLLLNRYGSVTTLHDKRYLVPFGEYIPFRPLLGWLLDMIGLLQSEYSSGQRNVPASDAPDYAAAVCFESLFPYQMREQINNGGRLIFVLTNDAWFGRTALLDIHLSFAVLRAVENNRYLVQAANTGRSAIIDNRGRIIKKSILDKQEWLEAEVALLKYPTPYTYLGEIIIYLACVFFLLYFYFFLVAKR